MTRARLILFRMAAVLIGLTVIAVGVVALELYASSRIHATAWNIRGYRGRILHAKATNELRVEAIGGSTTYGFTVGQGQSYPAQLEVILNGRYAARGVAISVANLGHLSDSSVCYWPTYRDYASLKADVVILYEGYNDAGRARRRTEYDCYRQSSAIFRWTGFFPTFPIFLREHWYRLRYGSIAEGYRAAAEVPAWRTPTMPTAEEAYATYETNVLGFVDRVLRDGKSLVFAAKPYIGQPEHLDQQTRIRAALAPYMARPRFRYRDFLYLFGGRYDPAWFNAQMWLNPRGNRVLAERMAEPVGELLDAELAQRGR